MVVSHMRRNIRRSALPVLAYGAGRQVGNYIRSAYGKTRSAPAQRSSGSSVPSAVTFQHDSKLTYRRRRAPRKVRRRARRAQKRFEKQDSKTLGLVSRVFQQVDAPATITPASLVDSQTVYTTGLYGGIPGSVGWGDIYAIANAEAVATKSGNLNFRTAHMDCQLRNSSTTNVLVADVYTVVSRKEAYNEPGEDWTQGLLSESVAAGTSAITPLALGCTPFDAPGFGSSWLVLSKTTYRISPGNSVYLTLKGRRGVFFNTDRMEYDVTNTTFRIRMFKGLSKGLMFVLRNADPIVGTPSKLGPIDYEVITTKTYRYGIKAYATDQAGQS